MIEEFAIVDDDGQRGLASATERSFALDARDAGRLLVALLEELIYLVDAEGLVPWRIDVDHADERQCSGRLLCVPVELAVPVGSVPKSVALSGLEVGRSDDAWVCRVVIDI